MRTCVIALAALCFCILPLQARSDAPPGMSPGCALPNVAALARRIFGPYAAAYHGSGIIPGGQSANGKIRIMAQGEVSCIFARNAGASPELLFVTMRVYHDPNDAATAFMNDMPLFKTFRHVGTVQLAEINGKIVGYQNDSLAQVWWAVRSGSRMLANPSVPGTRLEPIAIALISGH